MAFSYSPRIITDGLVLYLDAANTRSYPGSGTAWNDLSRSGNNGTLTNGPTFSSGNGGSIVFDGADDYVQTSNTSFNSSTIAVSVWINRSTTATTFPVIASKEGVSSGWILHIINTNKIFWKINNNNSTAITTTSSLTVGLWYNIVGIYTGSQLAVYINGILDSTTSDSTGINSNSTTLRIGEYQTTGNAYRGNIANIQIYNRALSSTEILQNYNATKGRFGL
jgi:hypothetical protein